jgi:ABC-type Fe3+ transport system permease subunit
MVMRIVFYSILILGIIGVISGVVRLFVFGREYTRYRYQDELVEAYYHSLVNGMATSLTIVGGALLFLWLL